MPLDLRTLEKLTWDCREGAHTPETLAEAHRALGEFVDIEGVAAAVREVVQQRDEARRVARGGEHEVEVSDSGHVGFNTGRTQYRVVCHTCRVLIHPATTGGNARAEMHRGGERDVWLGPEKYGDVVEEARRVARGEHEVEDAHSTGHMMALDALMQEG